MQQPQLRPRALVISPPCVHITQQLGDLISSELRTPCNHNTRGVVCQGALDCANFWAHKTPPAEKGGTGTVKGCNGVGKIKRRPRRGPVTEYHSSTHATPRGIHATQFPLRHTHTTRKFMQTHIGAERNCFIDATQLETLSEKAYPRWRCSNKYSHIFLLLAWISLGRYFAENNEFETKQWAEGLEGDDNWSRGSLCRRWAWFWLINWEFWVKGLMIDRGVKFF